MASTHSEAVSGKQSKKDATDKAISKPQWIPRNATRSIPRYAPCGRVLDQRLMKLTHLIIPINPSDGASQDWIKTVRDTLAQIDGAVKDWQLQSEPSLRGHELPIVRIYLNQKNGENIVKRITESLNKENYVVRFVVKSIPLKQVEGNYVNLVSDKLISGYLGLGETYYAMVCRPENIGDYLKNALIRTSEVLNWEMNGKKIYWCVGISDGKAAVFNVPDCSFRKFYHEIVRPFVKANPSKGITPKKDDMEVHHLSIQDECQYYFDSVSNANLTARERGLTDKKVQESIKNKNYFVNI